MAPEIIEAPLIPVRPLKRRSDEGYNSDHSGADSSDFPKSAKIRKVDLGEAATKEEIDREGDIFKNKYHVRKVFYNSANGVIYTGK